MKRKTDGEGTDQRNRLAGSGALSFYRNAVFMLTDQSREGAEACRDAGASGSLPGQPCVARLPGAWSTPSPGTGAGNQQLACCGTCSDTGGRSRLRGRGLRRGVMCGSWWLKSTGRRARRWVRPYWTMVIACWARRENESDRQINCAGSARGAPQTNIELHHRVAEYSIPCQRLRLAPDLCQQWCWTEESNPPRFASECRRKAQRSCMRWCAAG